MKPELEQYVKLVAFLSETLGTTFDVGLFDMTDPSYPVVACTNAQSDAQEKLRGLLPKLSSSRRARTTGRITNRPIEIDFGKLFKVSVFFLCDGDGQFIGALWLGMRCDLFMKLDAFASSLLQFNVEDFDEDGMETERSAVAREPSLDSIEEIVDEFGVDPRRTSMDERMEIICDLYDMGVYNLKGAVAKTAEVLHISEQSVYRYLAKIKKARDW